MVHKFLYWMEGVGFFKSLMHDFNMELQENKTSPILGKSHLLSRTNSVSKTAFNLQGL